MTLWACEVAAVAGTDATARCAPARPARADAPRARHRDGAWVLRIPRAPPRARGRRRRLRGLRLQRDVRRAHRRARRRPRRRARRRARAACRGTLHRTRSRSSEGRPTAPHGACTDRFALLAFEQAGIKPKKYLNQNIENITNFGMMK